LLNQDGYTIRGVQQLLANGGGERAEADEPAEAPPAPAPVEALAFPLEKLHAVRRLLVAALEESAV
jgi:hypothetical protein